MPRKSKIKKVIGRDLNDRIIYDVMNEIELILSEYAKEDWKDVVLQLIDADTEGFIEYIIKAPKGKIKKVKEALEKIADGLITIAKIYSS